ncbi:MAG: efflux RND transporter permease subunit [Clostridia bacterium]|nr:efflux RND transporter permease subunit [Clostridia bacterium]
MRKFFAFIIRQSVAVVLISLFILGFGVWSTANMSINLLPDINVPVICVQVVYAGANASTVEKDVTEKVEDGLSSLGGVTDVMSYSYDNLSAVVLYFDYDTDTTAKKSEIQSKLNAVDLPDGVSTTVYDVDLNAEPLAVLSLTSADGLDEAYARAKELSDRLSAIDGVESVELKGGADKTYLIQPFAGLELISPLLVEAFSYGSLDLPLGSVTENGGVQIKNESDISCREDIDNMPVELPSNLISLLASVKQVMGYYEDSTVQDLEKLRDDLGAGVLTVLNDLGNLSAEEIDDLSDLKTYMNIGSTYTAQQLKSFRTSRYYNELKKQVVNDDGTPKTDEELEDLAKDINSQVNLPITVSADLLRVVRDDKLNDIIGFREWLEETDGYKEKNDNNEFYELTNDDYFVLETEYVKVYADIYAKAESGEITRDEADEKIYANIDFAKQTSATGLGNIAKKKRDEGAAYNPTNAECALLFSGTTLSEEHPIIMSPTFMAFVRSENYDENMQTLIDTRGALYDENYDGDSGEEAPITARQWNGLYCSLKLNGVFDFKLSEQLFQFIIDTDFTDLNANGGKVVKVSDVANITVDLTYASYAYYFDGSVNIADGIVINIYKSNGANSSKVVERVKAVYAEVAAEEGYSATINLLDDQSEFISDSVSNVLISMLIGGVLAIIIIFLFLKKVRTSLVIAITMPLSVLAALICLFLLGVTLNMVSLGGLAVGIGMLVDNSIVVIEAITKHRDNGKDAFNAAVDGTCEVGGALFGSTVTTVCVFIPIMFAGGLTAEIFTDLALAVIFSLTFSLLVAVTVIPTLYTLFCGGRRILKENAPRRKMPVPVEEQAAPVQAETEKKKSFREKIAVLKKPVVMDGCTRAYSKVLPKVLSQKLVTILVAAVVFGASIGLLFLTGTEFLPSIDKGQIEVSMTYSGASLEEVQDDVLEFSKRISEEVDGIDYLSASIGKNGLLALSDSGIITVQMKSNKNTAQVVNRIRALAEEYKPTGSVTVKEIDGVVASLMSGTDDMSVTVIGSDGDTLLKIAEEIGGKLTEAGFTDVKNSAADKSKQYTLKFDRTALLEKGIDYKTLVMTLRIGLASYTACTVTINGENRDIAVKFDDNAITSRESLENFAVGFDGSEAVLLKDVCEVMEEEKEACIRRSNGNNMISVSAVLPDTDTGTASKKLANIASSVLKNYDGYGFEESGITTYLNDAFAGLAVALVISFFLLYAVMAIQFSSFLKPLIIMASIPFSFTGGFIALVITGTSLNVVSFIGLIMLMGVVVNNAIVMLEKIKQLKAEMPHFEAVKNACAARLRPIFMTTLTTILALIPMAIGVGQGSELMQPLGIVVIGGLLIGTLVTLLLVPAVYCAVHRISAKYPDGKRKHSAGPRI